jgi:hypothetical protein
MQTQNVNIRTFKQTTNPVELSNERIKRLRSSGPKDEQSVHLKAPTEIYPNEKNRLSNRTNRTN